MLKPSSRGFTLVETLLGASLGLVASGAVIVVAMNASSIWRRTTTILLLDGQATLAMEDIRAALRGSQPAAIETVTVGGKAFDQLRYLRGEAFDPISGDMVWGQERLITVVEDTQTGEATLVLRDPQGNGGNGVTLRTLARRVDAFDVEDPTTDSELAPDELRVALTLAHASLGVPFTHRSVVSTRQGFETVILREAEAGAQTPPGSWTITSDPSASAGRFITVTDASQIRSLRITFTVPSAAQYYIWGKGRLFSGSCGFPYRFQVDGIGDPFPWGDTCPPVAAWQWYLIDMLPLEAGLHQLDLQWGAGCSPLGWGVDRILITSKPSFLPTF